MKLCLLFDFKFECSTVILPYEFEGCGWHCDHRLAVGPDFVDITQNTVILGVV